MRAFVAVVPPDTACAELAAAVTPLRSPHPDLRWTPAAQWHLTLAFLGEVDEGVLPELTERLARAAHRHAPTVLTMSGAGRFGDRVLWTRVRAERTPGGADLRRLAAAVTAAARRCGIGVDDRAYRPHLTIARSRGGTDLRPLVAQLSGFAGTPWAADALHLVRSRLGAGPQGTAVHDVLQTWSLGR